MREKCVCGGGGGGAGYVMIYVSNISLELIMLLTNTKLIHKKTLCSTVPHGGQLCMKMPHPFYPKSKFLDETLTDVTYLYCNYCLVKALHCTS